jgi:predicted permease
MIGLTVRILRLLLRLYPSRFRDRFADDVIVSVRGDLERASAAGRGAVARASASAIFDAMRGVIPEHRARRRPSRIGGGIADDVRYAVRTLRRSPTFTLVALAVLALGIAAATTIFSVVDAVVLRGLPFDEHDRIAGVLEHNLRRPQSVGNTLPQNYLDWRERQSSFAALAALNRITFYARNNSGGLDTVRGLRVTREFFTVLRVEPAIGRSFTAADELPGAHRRLILSHGFWLRRFGGADVIGTTIEINREQWEIAGIMPRGFSYPVGSAQPTDLFAPLAFSAAERRRGGGRSYQYTVIGRLKDGVSIAQADDDMKRVAAAVDAANPGFNSLNPGGNVRVQTLHEMMVGRVRSWMLMLLGSVTLLLVIACANVANLMLARATVRGREIGLRAALGASRWRLTRELLVEGVLLSFAAAAIGILLSMWGVRALTGWMPEGIPRVADIAIDLRVLAATVVAAVITGITFGLVPALQGARPNLVDALHAGGRASTAGANTRRLRGALVVVEVALAVVLVVGASLFTASFVKVARIDPGFDYHGILALSVGVPFEPAKYPEAIQRGRPYVERMIESVRAVPGVGAVEAVSGGLPLSGGRITMTVVLPGRPPLTGDDGEMDTRVVTPGYLQMLGIPLIRGRYLSAGDLAGSPQVIVVNESAARKYWPGEDPIGQRIRVEGAERTVVGIVGDIRHSGPEIPPQQEGYVPLAQQAILQATLVMRPSSPSQVLPAVKAAIWTVNREQVLFTDRVTLDSYMDGLIAQRRFNMALLALFGMLGLVICAVGIYGVMAYIVSQRTREIGVRMALGASRGTVVRMVLRNSGLLVAIGLALGSAGAWYASGAARAFLFELDARDPRAFAVSIAVLALSALVATAVPARRAAGVDPMIALRAE